MRTGVFFLLAAIALTGCNSNERQETASDPVNKETALEQGKEITRASFKALSANLKQALEEGGVSYALEFCKIEAMPITDSLSNKFDVDIGRASHKPRNPANRADSLEMVSIKRYLDQIERGEQPRPVVYSTKKGYLFHSPIRASNQLCMNCHGIPGEDISRENLEVIRDLYPRDEATGFAVGDLRGIWTVEFTEERTGK